QFATEELPIVVIHSSLIECLSQSLGHAAVYLSVNQQWIDDIPAVVHSYVAENANLTSFPINFCHRDMCAERKGKIGRFPEIRCLQSRLLAGRQLQRPV